MGERGSTATGLLAGVTVVAAGIALWSAWRAETLQGELDSVRETVLELRSESVAQEQDLASAQAIQKQELADARAALDEEAHYPGSCFARDLADLALG